MKPINEMSLAECIDALEEITNQAYSTAYSRGHEDTVDGGYVYVLPIDSDSYFRDDAIEFWKPLASRIHDLTRWIPVEERLPTEADADENGRVLWYFKDQYQQTLMRDMPRWKMSYERVTHWRRSDNPEGV
jgi:hypothetical protein